MSLQTRLQALIVRIATEFKTIRQNFIPYTGASTSVNLNNKNLSNINDFSVNGMMSVLHATTRKFKDVLSYYILNYPMGSLAIKFPYQSNAVIFDVDIIISQYGMNWNSSGTMKLNVTFYWYFDMIHSSGLSVQINSLKTGINKDDYRVRLSKDPSGRPTILIGYEDKQFTQATSFFVSEVRLRHIGANDAVFENRSNYSIQAGITDITGYSTPIEPPIDSFATRLLTPRKINGVNFDGTADITIADSTKEPTFSKNTAFNKSFGTTAGTVAQGNDSRMVNGQTAYGWGNHAGLYSPVNHSHAFSSITGKPTTLSGYGITDAITKVNIPWTDIPHNLGSAYGGSKIQYAVVSNVYVLDIEVVCDGTATSHKMDFIVCDEMPHINPQLFQNIALDAYADLPESSVFSFPKLISDGTHAQLKVRGLNGAIPMVLKYRAPLPIYG